MVKFPFAPAYGQGQVVSPAAVSATITIGKGSKNLCFTNLGTNVCYVRVSGDGTAATTADYPIPPNGSQVVITKFEDYDQLSHISADGTTLQVIPGEGW